MHITYIVCSKRKNLVIVKIFENHILLSPMWLSLVLPDWRSYTNIAANNDYNSSSTLHVFFWFCACTQFAFLGLFSYEYDPQFIVQVAENVFCLLFTYFVAKENIFNEPQIWRKNFVKIKSK